ncbi:MAG TPA: amino acid ABC transporter permease [Stellaceae bacterium]|nr:amino acid ABC transporter permease [Stellaceae bacterium]
MIEFLGVYRQHLDDWLPELLIACIGTLELMALSFVLASMLGLAVALMRVSRSRLLQGVGIVYVEAMRGMPALVILFLIYFGLGGLGIEWLKFTSYQAAILGLGLQGGAVLGEVFRSGIEALHHGQMEAALSLGMTPATSMRWIILPQAARIVLPPVANYAIGLLKDTSVCAIIAAPELMLRAKDIASSSFRPMHLFVLAAVLYFIMSYPLSIMARWLEARLARGR